MEKQTKSNRTELCFETNFMRYSDTNCSSLEQSSVFLKVNSQIHPHAKQYRLFSHLSSLALTLIFASLFLYAHFRQRKWRLVLRWRAEAHDAQKEVSWFNQGSLPTSKPASVLEFHCFQLPLGIVKSELEFSRTL